MADPKMKDEAQAWIESCLRDTSIFAEGFMPGLRDGCALCNLVNFVKPGMAPKPKKSTRPFDAMENVSAYLRACKVLGVPDHELFQTVDLTEEKSVKAVLINIHALGRTAQRLQGYEGPVLGAKLATANSRDFSDSQKVGTYLSKVSSQSVRKPAEQAVPEANLYPVEQAELTLLQMLAQAAAIAFKKWKVQKQAAEKAVTEAARKDEVAKEAAEVLAAAEKAKDAVKAAAAKAEAQAAEAEAEEAAEAARKAKEAEAKAEKAAKLAEAAYQAALLEAQEEEAQAAATKATTTTPGNAGLPAAPPATSEAAATEAMVAEALANAPELKEEGGGREEELLKELEATTASLTHVQAECSALAKKLQESEAREASLRKMIQLALAEPIPPNTIVESAQFMHGPA